MLHCALRVARRARARAPLSSGASEPSASVVDCAVTSALAGQLSVACARVTFPADAAQHVHEHAAQMAWCVPSLSTRALATPQAPLPVDISAAVSAYSLYSLSTPQGPLRRCVERAPAFIRCPLQRGPGSNSTGAFDGGTAVRCQRNLPAGDWRRSRRVEPATGGDFQPQGQAC